MQAGNASLEQSTAGAALDLVEILIGTQKGSSSAHYLYFRKDGMGEAIHIDHTRNAFYCPHCEALLITATDARSKTRRPLSSSASDAKPKRPTETPVQALDSEQVSMGRCPACGGAITPAHQHCPGCDIALR